MKHKLKITLILLVMFIVTQFIGLYVVNYYSPVKVVEGVTQVVNAPQLPYGLETPKIEEKKDFIGILISFIISFIFAITIILLLTKLNTKFILRAWFFIVVILALSISLNTILPRFEYTSLVALGLAMPLAFIKIYKKNFIVHNATELLIYPGIAAVFVPLLNIYTLIVLLIIISLYDMWAVWHSGIMQKMAKYQIDSLGIFSGFFVPYLDKKIKAKLKLIPKNKLKGKKVKVNLAILGGGDVVFPIIASGVMLRTLGLIPAICITIGATCGLTYLFFVGEKRKFYPAMPYITSGIFLGFLISLALLQFGLI